MSREVKLIKGLEVSDALAVDGNDYHRFAPIQQWRMVLAGDGTMIAPIGNVQTYDSPIHHISKMHANGSRDDLYIAFSPEVQELLGIPIDCISREAEDARIELYIERQSHNSTKKHYETMGFIDGIKFWWGCNW